MENNRPIACAACRLCMNYGSHDTDIFDGNSEELRQTISKLYDVKVENTDKSSKICATCFCNLNEYLEKRKVCAAVNSKMKNTVSDGMDDVVVVEFPQEINTGQRAGNVCISLIDDESDAENDMTSSVQSDNTNSVDSAGIITANTLTAMQPLAVRSSVIVFNQHVTHPLASHLDAGCIECISLIDDDTDSENEGLVICEQIGTKQIEEDLTSTLVNINNQAGNEININTNDDSHNPEVVCDSNHQRADDRNEASCTANHSTENRAGIVPVKCDYGSSGWFPAGKKSMQEHVTNSQRKENNAFLECRLCAISFARKQAHQRHMDLRHSHQSPFKCPIPKCSGSFSKEIYVDRHIAIAHRNKPRPCSDELNRKSFLKKHSASTHDHNIAYCCYLCTNSQFSSTITLRWHMLSIHSRQRIQCPMTSCSKNYGRRIDLKRHVNAAHTRVNVFKCSNCSSQYYYLTSLERHMKKHT